jgi:hypothetical protein
VSDRGVPVAAQTESPSPAGGSRSAASPTPDNNTILLTIFLRHDESKSLGQIDDQLTKQGFFKAFPPPGIKVVSWYVMMGIGQVVTLEVPAARLRDVNRAIETTAWGGFRTQFYPTYDYKAVALQLHNDALSK